MEMPINSAVARVRGPLVAWYQGSGAKKSAQNKIVMNYAVATSENGRPCGAEAYLLRMLSFKCGAEIKTNVAW